MCEGEFESLKAIYIISPNFVPRPYAWGRYVHNDPETYFLLTEFRNVGEQVGICILITSLFELEDQILFASPIFCFWSLWKLRFSSLVVLHEQ